MAGASNWKAMWGRGQLFASACRCATGSQDCSAQPGLNPTMKSELTAKPMLLIVDDEKPTREGLRAAMEDQYDVWVAEDAKSAMNLLEQGNFAVMLTDFRLPQEDGMKLIGRAKSLPKPPVCILMTAYGSEELAVQAMKQGADDYIAKGRLQIDELEMRIGRALRQQNLEVENVALRQQLQKKFGLENIIGQSTGMQEVFDIVRQVAPTRATVLLLGESGTGKELIAKAIHQLSPRANFPMVTVHCAALSSTLLESELFGHEKGAFTGAHEKRVGRFELAQGGTLFLDEIGEIDQTLQVTLLPLRGRAGDIPLLAKAFLAEFARENNKKVNDFTPDALEALMNYSWPGNVRELRTAVERAVVLARGERISLRDLPGALRAADLSAGSPARLLAQPDLTVAEAEKQLIVRALKESDGNRTAAAKKLGMSRRTLHRKLHHYHLEGF